VLGAGLGLPLAGAAGPEAGRPGQDRDDPRGAAYRAAGPGALPGAHLLPHRPDRPGGEDSRRGTVEHPDDPQGRVGAVQQGPLGPGGELAGVGDASAEGGPPPGGTVASHRAYLPPLASPVAKKLYTSPTAAAIRAPSSVLTSGA